MALLSAFPLRRWPTMLAALCLAVAGMVHAQALIPASPSAATDSADPPSRVARLSYLSGDVGLLPAGASQWGEAGVNRPLTGGDRLSTGPEARAELELDGATLRIGAATDFGFLELDDPLAQVELTQGTVNLAVRRLGAGQSYEIDTPTVALVVDDPGTFRIDADPDQGNTRITVWEGSATVYGDHGAERRIVAGRSYRFDDASLNAVVLSEIAGGDAFDAWCSDRDGRYAGAQAPDYVSPDVIGYQDLAHYGDWRSDPDYGEVWYPSQVGGDWAPYRDGHWAWIGPWGWTWVDNAPWGFAPYHYGRWAFLGGAWGWVPGPAGVRPIYAPALVVFVGGGGWNVSVGVGQPIGWFPLGPGELYDPWYGGSQRYYTQVNVTNIYGSGRHRHDLDQRIHRHYERYRKGTPPPIRAEHYAHRNAHGFTAMPARSFAAAAPVGRHRLRLDPRHLAAAPRLDRRGTPRPTAHSMAPPRASHARPLPTRGFQRAVVTRHAPPIDLAGRRVVFAGHGKSTPHRPGAAAETAAAAAPAIVAAHGQPHHLTRPVAADLRGELRPGELRSARFVRSRPTPASRSGSPRQLARSGMAPVSRPSIRQPRETAATPRTRPMAPDVAQARARVTHAGPPTRAAVHAPRPLPPSARPAARPVAPHSMRALDLAKPRQARVAPRPANRPPPGYQPPRGHGLPRLMPQQARPAAPAPRHVTSAPKPRAAVVPTASGHHGNPRKTEPKH